MSGPATTPRPDLAWLRHRSARRPRPAGDRTPTPPRSTAPLTEFLAGRTTRPRADAPVADDPVAPSDLDLSGPSSGTVPGPAPTSDLDLSAPGADLDLSTPPAGLDLSAPAPALDLSGSTPQPDPVLPPSGADLDLFPEPPEAAPERSAPARPAAPVRPVPRTRRGAPTILTSREPTVTLTRVQSGVGALTVSAVCAPSVGDLRVGAVYQLADGPSGVLSRATGIPAGPPRSRRPVLHGSWAEHDRITLDLRQSRAVRRLIVYAFSESGRELAWGGTLVVTTTGGARVEVPMDVGRHAGTLAVLSLYAIDGEFVLRAEREPLAGQVRDVALAYGYLDISWADDRTPVL